MLDLLHEVIPDAIEVQDSTEIHFEVPVGIHPAVDNESPHRHSTLHRLLALVAGGLFKEDNR